ncbi:HIRAN domain-containing protein [Pantoea agglomerans]|uniref:HIRAN domain-containing protein n=1 Tax=Enterobacter agglomerans TaxID=549 RepID=UPI001FCE36C7|nr:HIRAN domain-containing protein [Pantoea agglomerans]WVJ45280.1 HIRAN domain-containing protein [Pantoea agglomerans]
MAIELIDVNDWRRDDEHGIFPIGARDKKMLWSPLRPSSNEIKPQWPYLFKLSRESYPDQFWMESIAYVIGNFLNINVPKALPATRINEDGFREYGALLEWFYDKDKEHFVHASDYFHVIIEDFDDDSGKHHNVDDLRLICRFFSIKDIISPKWDEWLTDLLLLDSLIGNSDRHQENWGFIFTLKTDDDGQPLKDEKGTTLLSGRLSPLFDNGTSLGHERFPDRVCSWNTRALDKYISGGNHHLRLTRSETKTRLSHVQSIQELAKEPASLLRIQKKLDFNIEDVCGTIRRLSEIDAQEGSLSNERLEWVIRLLKRRYTRLRLIINMRTINHIIEPCRLWLTWQAAGGGARYVIGSIERNAEEQFTFTYNNDAPDFARAIEKGFTGHPAFPLAKKSHNNNVLDPFLRRLPPRKRRDFTEYLKQHLLPADFSGSDFALLGYTGAKSPADGFSLIPDPSVFSCKGELLLEVAGTRYQEELDLSKVNVGDTVEFMAETDNPKDPDAVVVMHVTGKLGYINKVHCKAVKDKLRTNKLNAFIAKKNGTAERPLVYLLAECD